MDKKLSEFKAGDEGDVKSVAGEGEFVGGCSTWA